jgi:hypothetical protein
MAASALPHDPYVAAVDVALCAAGLGSDDGWTESPDGERLDAVLIWNHGPGRDAWPGGVLISWSQFDGWQYAGRRPDGGNEQPQALVHDFFAAPEVIVEAVRALLSGGDGLPLSGVPWSGKTELQSALSEWDES